MALDIDEFDNLNVFCFDLEQYNPNAKYLLCTVFLNYKGLPHFHDIKTWRKNYFKWMYNRWILYKNLDKIKSEGIESIVDELKYKDENE